VSVLRRPYRRRSTLTTSAPDCPASSRTNQVRITASGSPVPGVVLLTTETMTSTFAYTSLSSETSRAAAVRLAISELSARGTPERSRPRPGHLLRSRDATTRPPPPRGQEDRVAQLLDVSQPRYHLLHTRNTGPAPDQPSLVPCVQAGLPRVEAGPSRPRRCGRLEPHCCLLLRPVQVRRAASAHLKYRTRRVRGRGSQRPR